ncbi:MAG TPA: hypothetical protein DCQ31_04265 [Bacteroidales bacterium]|nr:hypothetical protein [Bacteroidales bacterium]
MCFILTNNLEIMKNYALKLLIFLFAVAPMVAQPVSDNAVIPVSVTLNSILRLNVVKGGNIAFKVNTIGQFTSGIANADVYDTRFTVASSVDFTVSLGAQDATFIGTDIVATGTNTMPIDNVGYLLSNNGTGVEGTAWSLGTALVALTNSQAVVVNSIVGAGAGSATKNDFTVNWELATPALIVLNTTKKTLLAQSLPANHYTTNVFLVLAAK